MQSEGVVVLVLFVFIILNIYKGNFAFRITNLSFEFVIIIIVYTDDRFWLFKALSIIFTIWHFVVILNVNISFMLTFFKHTGSWEL